MKNRFRQPHHNTTCYLYIGKVAELTGASRKAIRLYQDRGLIPAPERKNTYRIYSDLHVFMVHAIKQVQGVGFSLAETQAIMTELSAGGDFPLALVNDVFDRKSADIKGKIAALMATEKRLRALRSKMQKIFGLN
ncbi:MAG: MerR family transcriptional regulator [Rhodobacteraceae bacterium]|nr:MerR family transcriptional regulator [Paracoccaceae bacterium]